MSEAVRDFLRGRLASSGVVLRRASRHTGVDALADIEKLRNGRPVKLILDVGANVGQTALSFRRRFPSATIHSFEPVRASYDAGRAATAGCSTIHWHNVGVGSAPSRLKFYSSGTSLLSSLRVSAPDVAHGLVEPNEVEVITLDGFPLPDDETEVDVLKTDTEGADLEVLEGAESLLATVRVGCVLCEVGFTEADTAHSFFPPIAAYLERHGYRLFHFYGISGLAHFSRWGVTYADALFARPTDRP